MQVFWPMTSSDQQVQVVQLIDLENPYFHPATKSDNVVRRLRIAGGTAHRFQ